MPETTRLALLLALSLHASACGFRPMLGGEDREVRFCVVGGEVVVSDAAAALAMEGSVRRMLAQRSALTSCDKGRKVVVTLVELRTEPVGIVSVGGKPEARGVRVTAVVQGREEGATGGGWESDGEAVVASQADPSIGGVVVGRARAMAARKAGEGLARMLMGE